jgi:16S rRNA C967 or C1407 C5-methylase (RsmB/RsmF family)/NOL1/NOP2/fmu family ribosome biogenesis protein
LTRRKSRGSVGDDTLQFPAAFVDRMRARLGAALPAFLAALAEPLEGVRVNTLRLSPSRFASISPFPVRPLGYPEEGFSVEPGWRPGKDPYHAAGLYYVQDPGAMVVGALVGAWPGERVLDLAAAPGGKATHLGTAMRGRGLLVANDVSRSRAAELAGNLERFGIGHAIVTAERVDRLVAHFGAYFDRVLLDAPCSGESMFHKSATARRDWSPSAVAGCARRQIDLLEMAAGLVRPGGLLVYSTCTFSQEENEAVADRFLAGQRSFEPAALPDVPGAEPVQFVERVRGHAGAAAWGYRLWPHALPGAGHFAAAFRRSDAGEADPVEPWHAVAPAQSLSLLREFAEFAHVGADRDEGAGIVQLGRELYRLPEGAPDVRGLRVVRAGLRLGTVEPKRFEPAHALALALPPEGFSRPVRLEREDPRVTAFLTGAPIQEPGPPGWVPVLVNGFALGWGKRVGRVVKNHYPKGLRWRS